MRKGKCNYCGEKWDHKHRCLQRSNPQKLYACEAKEEEKISKYEESSEEDTRTQHDCHLELEDDIPNMSLAAITGVSQPQTLKLKGHQKQQCFDSHR